MGFVKISDDLTSWAWINDSKTVYIYVRLLLGAAWTETDFRNIHLKRGQIAVSQREFAEKCGVSRQELRTILDRLISTHKITQTSTNKFSIITMLEYDCATQVSTPKATTNQPTVNPPTTHNQPTNNPPTLLYTEDNTIRQSDVASASPTAASVNKESLIERFGRENVEEYEQRYDRWKASKGGVVRGDRYETILRMMEADGVKKSISFSSFDPNEVMRRILQRYSRSG